MTTLMQNPPAATNPDTQRSSAFGFETRLGWMAIECQGDQLARLTFDHRSRRSALRSLGEHRTLKNPSPVEQEIQDLLTRYAAGEEIDFGPIDVLVPWSTPFALRVVDVCRGIPYGETLSYGEVARIAGSAGAARAVGNIMASNTVPLVIPCHRVIGSHGALGGYSARGGLAVKEKLLRMEQR